MRGIELQNIKFTLVYYYLTMHVYETTEDVHSIVKNVQRFFGSVAALELFWLGHFKVTLISI